MIIPEDVECIQLRKSRMYFQYLKNTKCKWNLNLVKKIKCLRTDNGGEYTDGEFLAFCKQEGI